MVAQSVDVVKEAGGRGKALVRTFQGVKVTDNLAVELVPRSKGKALHEVPILSALEVQIEPSK